jgi:Protein of unknown function (DUF3592)
VGTLRLGRKNAIHSRGDRLVGGIVTALGLLLLGAAWWAGNSRYTILKSWPTVEAAVTKSEVSRSSGLYGSSKTVYHTKIEFMFEAGGKQFTASSSDDSESRGGAQMTANNYAPGTRHAIRYNPANPNDIRFNAGYSVEFFLTPILFAVFGLSLVWFGLKLLWRSRSSKQASRRFSNIAGQDTSE